MSTRWSIFLLALAFLVQPYSPAWGQTVMLTGSAVKNDATLSNGRPAYAYTSRLVPMQAQAAAGQRLTTAVRPKPATKVRTVYVRDDRTFFQRHPMAKGAAIGAGVGAGAGALTGLITHRGILRGAAIGAGTGAGVGVIRTSQIMKRHPIVRDVATGAVSGLGLGWAAHRHNYGAIETTTGLGAAVGLGAGLLTHLK